MLERIHHRERLGRARRHQRVAVEPARERREPRRRRAADGGGEPVRGDASHVGDGRDVERAQLRLHFGADAGQRAHRQRRHKGFGLGVGETRCAIGLVEARRELGEQLVGRDADRRARPVSARTASLTRRATCVAAASSSSGASTPSADGASGAAARAGPSAACWCPTWTAFPPSSCRARRGGRAWRAPSRSRALSRAALVRSTKNSSRPSFCVGPKAQRTAKTDSDASRYGVRSSAGSSSNSGQRCFASSIRINFVTPAAAAGIIASGHEEFLRRRRRSSRVGVRTAQQLALDVEAVDVEVDDRARRHRGGVAVAGRRRRRRARRPPARRGRVRAHDRARTSSRCTTSSHLGMSRPQRRLSSPLAQFPFSPSARRASQQCMLLARRSARPRLSAARFPR